MLVPVVALLALALAAPRPGADPCAAASTPLARPADAPRDVARAIEAYRLAWLRACDPKATPDVARLFGDAEALAEDARTSRTVRAIADAADQRGAPWPLPGIRIAGGDLAVDWAAFAPLGARGSVADVRFWRGAAVASGAAGAPVWIEAAAGAPGGECIRLGATAWPEIAAALDDMDSAKEPQYVAHARELRERFLATLQALATGPEVCGCVSGAAEDGLATLATLVHGDHDELGVAAQGALQGMRTGRVKVRWLREVPGGEPVGCRATP